MESIGLALRKCGGAPFKEYYATLTMGKELAMVENNDRGLASCFT
jgi:hypothetical protein